MRARDGNVHRGKPKEGYLPMISHLGASISVVNGALMAKRMKGEKHFVGAASIGDGATSTGAFHEALNQAAIERLLSSWSWPTTSLPIPLRWRANLPARIWVIVP